MFSVFSLMFGHVFLKHNRELRIKIFELLFLISMLIVMKYSNHSEAYNNIRTCIQSHLVTYESINTYEYVEISCLYPDITFLSIAKI